MVLVIHGAASSSSGPLFLTFPTAFDTGLLSAGGASWRGFHSEDLATVLVSSAIRRRTAGSVIW
jgi:hypothetical protein